MRDADRGRVSMAVRLASLRPRVSPESLECRNLKLTAELKQCAQELATAKASLEAGAKHLRQLADQQSALAEFGHLAFASGDSRLLARQVVQGTRRALGIRSVGVWRLEHAPERLEMVATDGCGEDQRSAFEIPSGMLQRLGSGRATFVDLASADEVFPLPVPRDARSGALVVIQTPAGRWGVLIACAVEADRFTTTEADFLEAAASLLGFSATRTTNEDAARHASLHDALTGLPNRAQMLKHMKRSLAVQPPTTPRLSAIFLDLDGFKGINDTLGHAAGDLVLIETAARLSSLTRPTDVLARLGGDEFVVLCDTTTEAATEAIATRLLSAFDEPFVVEGREIFLTASAGFDLAVSGVTADQVLANADLAMYLAKQRAGSTIAAFRADLRERALTENLLHNELRRARERGELRAVYQPIVDLGDGTVHSVEALIRWRHPTLGDVPAAQTVAAAQRIGLSGELTSWIVGEAATTVSAWNSAHRQHHPLRLAVNVTALFLDDPHVVDGLDALVAAAGLPFHLLDVELTETAFADPTPQLLHSIDELRRRGAKLAMDDFGTGYSSLISLNDLTFDVLKIDRSFVTPLDRSDNRLLVSAMTGIALGRHLTTVGEGIETARQLRELIIAECDLGQGYLFARPLERDDLVRIPELEVDFADTVRSARRAGLLHGARQALLRASSPRVRILVADDNPTDLELLESLLSAAGHEVVLVSDPALLISSLEETQPDLIVMDLRFAGGGGVDLLQRAGDLVTMPVLTVTGYPAWAMGDAAPSQLHTDVLLKPLDAGELFHWVQAMLARPQTSALTPRAGSSR